MNVIKNQQGITTTTVIGFVLILVIVGFTGWRVMEANKEIDGNKVVSNQPNNKNEPDSTSGSTVKIPDNYKTYTNKTLDFSFAYPESWGKPTQQSDPANSSLFLLLFSLKEQDLAVELRAQAADSGEIVNSDSRYARGYIRDGSEYYIRTISDVADPDFTIAPSSIVDTVDNGFGKALLVEATSVSSYQFLDGIVNLGSKKYPGLTVNYINTRLADIKPNAQAFNDQDIETMKKILGTFQPL